MLTQYISVTVCSRSYIFFFVTHTFIWIVKLELFSSRYRVAESHNLNARSLLPLFDAVALRKADGKLCIFSKTSAANKNKQSLKV